MITKEQIDSFIQRIPPAPKVLQETINLLDNGELTKAAKTASQDVAFNAYIQNLVNKPAYGLQHQVSDTSQIFSLLGIPKCKQIIYSYILTLLSPEKWSLFELDFIKFKELQANISGKWNLILEHLKIVDKSVQSSISLLPASLIVADALFKERIDDVKLLKETKNLDYNTILKRICGIDIFDLCEEISKKWGMDENVGEIIQSASGVKKSEKKDIEYLGKWMHLLLFYEFSKPVFIEAGLNDFIDFQIDFVDEIYEDFMMVINGATK
ncbi:MAG: HDOD domain-containing protein [Campylobacterales bacterium]|nr:HDOD domain-containing protein [Campylobacterales bacterium]